ncbi:hypothetical protein C1645_825179 [Glomus cerebriforme]|uniref:HTH psq-type domain-containing protein n=1 Tax=Glomus cerebriforme TaxID=658196 RepID=A0A397T236_9GLOM|nr:hypothetical protein C1645_825179 [Glomus cerebriforme]
MVHLKPLYLPNYKFNDWELCAWRKMMKSVSYTNITLYKKQKLKRRQWLAREKLIVIVYYEQGHSKRSTADKFEVESKQLHDWLKHKEQLMKTKACTLAKKLVYETVYLDIKEAKFSQKWVDSFIREHQYPLSLIANMDEPPLAFNLPSNTTVEQCGTKTIST